MLAGLLTAALPAKAQLNDTGQDKCYDGTNTLASCSDANTGDTASWPRQDGRFGRDAAAAAGMLPKTGGGAAGFDFTKVCMSGELAGQGDCPANPSVGTGANDWACTKDNHTKLLWSLDSPVYNWTDATTTYPAAMNITNLCGYDTGWRAPTIGDLLSIVDNGRTSPSIDVNYFPNTVNGMYWSTDTYAPQPGLAWIVGLNDGETSAYYKTLGAHVRLVHGGQSGHSFMDNGDGTVTDNETGLMWDKCSWGQTGPDCSGGNASGHPWVTANPEVVVALRVAVDANTAKYKGYNDWRLPSKNELESLVDRLIFNPAINHTAFPNTLSYYYWTSTTLARNTARAWGVHFSNGNTVPEENTYTTIPVRLVRGGYSSADYDLLNPQPGKLEITKVVNWNGSTPDPNAAFEICIKGPSYPSDDCKTITGDAGGVLSWYNLEEGTYSVTETDPGTRWEVIITSSPVQVNSGQTAQVTVTNTYRQTPLPIFISYKTSATRGSPYPFPKGLQVTLTDQFATHLFDIKRSVNLLNPDLGTAGVDADTHLRGYALTLTKTQPAQPKPVFHLVKVDNPLGPLFLNTKTPDLLLVPTAKSLTGPVDAPDPDDYQVDHFKCYPVSVVRGCTAYPWASCRKDTDCAPNDTCNTGFSRQPITVQDQFQGPKAFEVMKPTRLCIPTDKEHEGVWYLRKQPENHLLCYQVKPAKGTPKFQRRDGIYINNQFGPEQIDVLTEEEVCVPSSKEDLGPQ